MFVIICFFGISFGPLRGRLGSKDLENYNTLYFVSLVLLFVFFLSLVILILYLCYLFARFCVAYDEHFYC